MLGPVRLHVQGHIYWGAETISVICDPREAFNGRKVDMKKNTTAGNPTANHQQMTLNILKVGVPTSTLVATVYSRDDAAWWLIEHVGELRLELHRIRSGLKSAFQDGGRVYELGGWRVVKTKRPAPHRSVHNAASSKDRERRVKKMFPVTVTVTTWRNGSTVPFTGYKDERRCVYE